LPDTVRPCFKHPGQKPGNNSSGTNFTVGQANLEAAVNRAIKGITNEARRVAVPITPVNPNGDELYHILRKRLFSKVAPEAEVQRVARDYRDALREANKMKLTTTSPESLDTRFLDSYPFHPDLRELVGKFKENEGFQQTRGVIRLMQMLVSNLWKTGQAKALDVIHPYDFDLNVDKLAIRAWYLHSSAASLRDCYQTIKVLPPPDEVQIEQDKTTLIIVRPGDYSNQLPVSSDWQAWWIQQPYKNRVLFLSGSRDSFRTRAKTPSTSNTAKSKTPTGKPANRCSIPST